MRVGVAPGGLQRPVSGQFQLDIRLDAVDACVTELIVYPGEYHVLTRPSFLVDRSRRYLDWMGKYLAQKP